MANEEVLNFVNGNKFEVTGTNSTSSRCIDGRYEDGESLPALAKPGADAGDLMISFAALNKLGVSASGEQVLNTVLEVVGGSQKFSFHSDQHNSANVPGIGCGHLKQAQLTPEDYGLKVDQIEYIFNSLPELMERGANQVVLSGNHEEVMVLIIDSEKFSVKPLHKVSKIQSFIYHQSLDKKRHEELARTISTNIELNGLSVDQVLDSITSSAAQQLGETAKRLAGALPVYNIFIANDGTVSIVE